MTGATGLSSGQATVWNTMSQLIPDCHEEQVFTPLPSLPGLLLPHFGIYS